MLEVVITLHDANTGEKRRIGRLLITNDGSGDRLVGNYDTLLTEDSTSQRVKLRGCVVGHPRCSSVWLLVRKAIDMLF